MRTVLSLTVIGLLASVTPAMAKMINPSRNATTGGSERAENAYTALAGKKFFLPLVVSMDTKVKPPKPTSEPTANPTPNPTANPTSQPTAIPTAKPTTVPTTVPTAIPTAKPTTIPTTVPTATAQPTTVPTAIPTAIPTTIPVNGTNYYVDNTCGVNGNGLGQSCATSSGGTGPFNSLANAQAKMTGSKSDVNLLLKRGQQYPGPFTVSAYGTSGHPFTIGAYGTGNRPVISGGSSNLVIKCASCQYITVDGLEMANSTGTSGVYIYNPAGNVTIKNSYIHHSVGNEIFLYQSQYNVFDNNEIAWGTSEGIRIMAGDPPSHTAGNIISNNKIHNNKRYGILTNGAPSPRFDGAGSKIFGNDAYNNSTGIYLVFTNGFEIYNNKLHDNGLDCQGSGTCSGEPYGFAIQSGSYNSIHDNTIYGNYITGVGIYGDQSADNGPADYNKFFRNVVYGTIKGRSQKEVEWQAWAGDSVGTGNLVYENIIWGTGLGFAIDDTNPNIGGNAAYNNTIYSADSAIFFVGSGTSAGWTLKNNILVSTGSTPLYAANRSSGLVLQNNLYYKPSGGTMVQYKGASYSVSAVTGLDAKAVTSDPKFVGTSKWSDFRLQTGSPAIDKGTNLGTDFQTAIDPAATTWPAATVDQNSYGSGWEIGAFTYK